LVEQLISALVTALTRCHREGTRLRATDWQHAVRNEADAYADNVAGNDPAPGTIVYSGDLEHGFTSERLSEVFGLELEVTHANGRWSAYAR
jgi:ABC-type cobalamin/Fe3+-siderophores transport system ATPase subunit